MRLEEEVAAGDEEEEAEGDEEEEGLVGCGTLDGMVGESSGQTNGVEAGPLPPPFGRSRAGKRHGVGGAFTSNSNHVQQAGFLLLPRPRPPVLLVQHPPERPP